MAGNIITFDSIRIRDDVETTMEALFKEIASTGTSCTVMEPEIEYGRIQVTGGVTVHSTATGFACIDPKAYGSFVGVMPLDGYQYLFLDTDSLEYGGTAVVRTSWTSDSKVFNKGTLDNWCLCAKATDNHQLSASELGNMVRVFEFDGSASNAFVKYDSANTMFVGSSVAKYIKELYIPDFDFSTIRVVRINRTSANRGLYLQDINNTTKLALKRNVADNVWIHAEGWPEAYAVIDIPDDSTSEIAAYINGIPSDCASLNKNPMIASLLSNPGVSINPELNRYLKYLYVPSDVSIDLKNLYRVRLFNGYGDTFGVNLIGVGPTNHYITNMERIGSSYVFTSDDGMVAVCDVDLLPKSPGYKDFAASFVHDYSHLSTDAINACGRKPSPTLPMTRGQILYELNGDLRSAEYGHVKNAVMYPDGSIIACRAGGTVERVNPNGTVDTLLTIDCTAPLDWRLLWIDDNYNVYTSPHASYGSMNVADRGLYRLAKGADSFVKVISLYDTSSSVPTETQNNDDTIWTMCKDDEGNLYAGVYAHLVRANPAVYKSTDNGLSWTYAFNFNNSGMTSNGMHIHCIDWDKYDKCLVCIVGEVNTIFTSKTGAASWIDTGIALKVKGSAIYPTENGLLVGSDGAYGCDIDLVDINTGWRDNVWHGWSNTVFAIRQSDISGNIYAFTKIDSSVKSLSFYPPVAAMTDATKIEEWRNSGDVTAARYNQWKAYHDDCVNTYPEDAVRPCHYAVLVSRDGGLTFEVLRRFSCTSTDANGFWMAGHFLNGELLAGRFESERDYKPAIVSEGKHAYTASGIDISGEILNKLSSSNYVSDIS